MATERNAMSMEDFLAGFEDLDGASEFKNLMIYGDSGVGKTVMAGSLPGRVCYLAGEPGYVSAGRQGAQGKVRVIPDTATAVAAIDWAERKGHREYDWFVLDGGSTMQNKFLLSYAGEAFDRNPASRAHRNIPDRADYFNAQNFMKGWMARWVDLPANVLVTAHAQQTTSEDGELLIVPGFQGKKGEVANYIAGLFHVVGYMQPVILRAGERKGEQVRRIFWQHVVNPETETRIFAKDQFDALGRWTDDTKMPELLARIDGEGVPASTPQPTKAASSNGSESGTVKPARRRRA